MPQPTVPVPPSFPRPGRDEILMCPVGGVGQIGMNWTLYGHDGKWILIDAGTAFPPRDVVGIEAVIPNPRVLDPILPNLLGMIVTHAHEDHIGAIHRLWPGLRVPIIATPFAASIISERLREAGTIDAVTGKIFEPGDRFELGPFSIKSIRMTHSVPECVSLAISTAAGTVLHTGDWKLDPDPVIGKPTDLEALAAVGTDGVLAMVCDSTNADRRGDITSERDAAAGMRAVLERSKGLVVVTCFATNVARVVSVATAAEAAGRTVGIVGRSLVRTMRAARECGLLRGVPEIVSDLRDLARIDRKDLVLVCTGSQGEANSALGRLAFRDDRRLPPIRKGDVIVHSARAVPGNEVDIEEMFAFLQARGAAVLRGTFDGHPLHVTGHATATEIEIMYRTVGPRYSIPVHGEASHLAAHADLAGALGVGTVPPLEEGDVLSISRHGVTHVARVDINLVGVVAAGSSVPFVPWDRTKNRPMQDSDDAVDPTVRRHREPQTPMPMVA